VCRHVDVNVSAPGEIAEITRPKRVVEKDAVHEDDRLVRAPVINGHRDFSKTVVIIFFLMIHYLFVANYSCLRFGDLTGAQTNRTRGIMRRQKNGRGRSKVFLNLLQRRYGSFGIEAYPVGVSFQKLRFGIACVPGQKIISIRRLNNNRDMVGCVTRRRNHQHIAGLRHRITLREGSVRSRCERNFNRRKPGWPAMREVTVQLSHPTPRRLILASRNQNPAVGEMMQPAGMVCVKMREDDRPHIFGSNPHRAQLRPDFLFRFDVKYSRAAIKRMPAWMIARSRRSGCLAGIHHDDAFGVFNHPRENRQPFAPVRIKKQPQRATRLALYLGLFDADTPGLNGVDFDPTSLVAVIRVKFVGQAMGT